MTDKKSARFERFSEKCPECGGLGTITRYYGGGEFISTIDCDRCLGRGAIGNCARCAGTGQAKEDVNPDNQKPAATIECPDCRGAGSIGDCTHCAGTGFTSADTECQACYGYGFISTDEA